MNQNCWNSRERCVTTSIFICAFTHNVYSCPHYINMTKLQETKVVEETHPIVHLLHKPPNRWNAKKKDQLATTSTLPYDSVLINNPASSKTDGRKNNSGSPRRKTYSIAYKVSFVEEVMSFIEDDRYPAITNATSYNPILRVSSPAPYHSILFSLFSDVSTICSPEIGLFCCFFTSTIVFTWVSLLKCVQKFEDLDVSIFVEIKSFSYGSFDPH